jgi:hypothetical protein
MVEVTKRRNRRMTYGSPQYNTPKRYRHKSIQSSNTKTLAMRGRLSKSRGIRDQLSLKGFPQNNHQTIGMRREDRVNGELLPIFDQPLLVISGPRSVTTAGNRARPVRVQMVSMVVVVA